MRKNVWKFHIKCQYTTEILAVLMSVGAVLSTSMKPEFCYIYSHISYLSAKVRAVRKADGLVEMKNEQNTS